MNASGSVRRTALPAALAALVLCGLAGPLQAADAPFNFTGTVRFVDSAKQFHVFAWEGRATHLGTCTGLGLVFQGGYVRHAYLRDTGERPGRVHRLLH